MTTRRFLLLIAAVLVGIVGVGLLTSCARSAPEAAPSPRPTPYHIIGPERREFVPRSSFTEENFGAKSQDDIAQLFRVELSLPNDIAGGGMLQGIFTPEDFGNLKAFVGVYSDATVVQVKAYPTVDAAKLMVDDYARSPFDAYATKHQVAGATAVAVPKLDVPPSFDGSSILPRTGTGLMNSTATVAWSRGRFLIEVQHPDKSVAQLLAVARAVVLAPEAEPLAQ